MKKTRILDAAEEIFADKGFDGAKVQEIADAAGVNKAMLYYYFGSKDDLLIAVIGRFVEGIRDSIPKYFASSHNTARNIEAFLDFYIEYLACNRSFVRLMAWELLSGKHVRIIARNYIIPTFGLLREKIIQAVAEGAIRPVSPEHTIFSVLGMNIFYIVASPLFTLVLGDDPLSPEMIIKRKRAVTDLIMNGLLSSKIRPPNSEKVDR
jgi:TetR/AcrR family transcriptional regulator